MSSVCAFANSNVNMEIIYGIRGSVIFYHGIHEKVSR